MVVLLVKVIMASMFLTASPQAMDFSLLATYTLLAIMLSP